MKKLFRHLAALLAVAITMLACSSSFKVVETQPSTPTDVAVETQPVLPTGGISQTEELTMSVAGSLPYSLYFLGNDSQSLTQVFRIERDSGFTEQITNEPVPVTYYDISPVNGIIAYVASNQLLLVNRDGSDRRVLIDGGSSSDLHGDYNPVFSPDGKILAYRQNGLNLYDLSTGTSTMVLEDQPLGGSLPPVTYSPDKFSPDGTKLLLNVGHPPDSPWSAAIYLMSTMTLTPIVEESSSLSCCYNGTEWSADGLNIYTVATTPDSSTPFGAFWKVDGATGAAITLISGTAGEGDTLLFHQTYKPHIATNGQLYFFSAKYPEMVDFTRRVPLLLVRSLPDDIITNWTVLRGDSFELMNEALWAPDALFVVVVFALDQDVYDGGRAEIVYLDGRPNVTLVAFARNMKWGP
jgi:hypothetical protein